MRAWNLGRYALTSCAAAAMLAGCGGSHPPIGAAAGAPSSVLRSQSGSGSQLLYMGFSGGIYVFSYPDGALQQTINVGLDVSAFCTDGAGNVYATVAKGDQGFVYEYAFGGTTPMAEYAEATPAAPNGCSVDPATGHVAVTNYPTYLGNSTVDVFQSPSSGPTLYGDSDLSNFTGCAFDSSGSLYVDGQNDENPRAHPNLIELPSGGDSFVDVSVNKYLYNPNSMQFISPYLNIANRPRQVLYRVAISGSTATVVAVTKVKGWFGEPWVQGHTLIAAYHSKDVGYWKYPKGGRAFKSLSGFGPGYALFAAIVATKG